jgi:hypothetical protein
VPKLNVPELSVSVDGLDTPETEANSSDVAALEEISTAPSRVLAPLPGWGVNSIATVQLAPAISVPHVVVTGKSAVLCTPETEIVAVPVFVTVMVCGEAALPTAVFAKLMELGKALNASVGAASDGEPTSTGVDVPVRFTRSAPETASLSMVSVPMSVLVGGGLDPVAAWLIGE